MTEEVTEAETVLQARDREAAVTADSVRVRVPAPEARIPARADSPDQEKDVPILRKIRTREIPDPDRAEVRDSERAREEEEIPDLPAVSIPPLHRLSLRIPDVPRISSVRQRSTVRNTTSPRMPRIPEISRSPIRTRDLRHLLLSLLRRRKMRSRPLPFPST